MVHWSLKVAAVCRVICNNWHVRHQWPELTAYSVQADVRHIDVADLRLAGGLPGIWSLPGGPREDLLGRQRTEWDEIYSSIRRTIISNGSSRQVRLVIIAGLSWWMGTRIGCALWWLYGPQPPLEGLRVMRNHRRIKSTCDVKRAR